MKARAEGTYSCNLCMVNLHCARKPLPERFNESVRRNLTDTQVKDHYQRRLEKASEMVEQGMTRVMAAREENVDIKSLSKTSLVVLRRKFKAG